MRTEARIVGTASGERASTSAPVVKPHPKAKLPVRVRLLILAMVAAGVACLAVRAPDLDRWSGRDLVALVVLAGGILIAEQFPVPLRHRSETLNLTLTEALWVAGLILARPSVLTFALLAGLGIGQAMRRWAPYKIAFNLGNYLLSLSLAQVVFGTFHADSAFHPKAWVATALGMTVYMVVNAGMAALVISIAEGKSYREVLLPPLRINVLHFATNTALGLSGAVIWVASPLGAPMLFLPLVLAFIVYRALVRSLQEGERLRSLIVEHASDGIFLANANCEIVSWNPAMERITGLSADVVMGRLWQEILDRPEAPCHSKKPGSHETSEAWFSQIERPDGARRWVLSSSATIRTRDGSPKATVIVAHDVTAEREAEQLKTDFVATISHELRTPLTPLKGFLSSLLRGTVEDSSEARQEYYEIMLRQADRLERLVRDLLEVSQIDAERYEVQNQSVDLTSAVAAQVRGYAEEYPGREIGFRASDERILVRADVSRVELIVSNLVSNALKYSDPEKPVGVDVAVRDHHAVVSVHDRGDGIPAAEQPRVFDRFYQVEDHLTRSNGGIGLGLYVAKRLVEAMCGHIWVESIPGRGSTFSFSLPLLTSPPRTVRTAQRHTEPS